MPEQGGHGVDRAERETSEAIGRLVVSSSKRRLVFGEDSMKKVQELAQYFVDMVNRARRGKG